MQKFRGALRMCGCRQPMMMSFRSHSTMSRLDQLREQLAAEDSAKSTHDLQPVHHAAAPTFAIETYGCQMNVSDSEIVRSILLSSGWKETGVPSTDMAEVQKVARQHKRTGKKSELPLPDVTLINTCAIRDNAENRVWQRLHTLNALRKATDSSGERQPMVGVLGCMAERLKQRLLEDAPGGVVDLVVGPDAYRQLPSLLNKLQTEAVNTAMDVQLSLEETYADIAPVRPQGDGVSAFVSIMRGCNNMCSYCVVPFTRGRERSRPLPSILDEVRQLVDQGYKEITLLGQNVNSYHDRDRSANGAGYQTAPGFSNMFRTRDGEGWRFVDLLDQTSSLAGMEDVRVRFTSPHPKDFPLPLLQLIAERPQLCKQLHLPAQSGSNAVLDRMRRGYTVEAYENLVETARSVIGQDLSFSSDFIAGFCGETEEDHRGTVDLIKRVGYDQAYLFAYSLRERTHAAHKLQDDVSEQDKSRRLQELIDTWRNDVTQRNRRSELNIDQDPSGMSGRVHRVLVEGKSKRADHLTGRTDSNKRILFTPLDTHQPVSAGEYAFVQVTDVTGHTLRGKAVHQR